MVSKIRRVPYTTLSINALQAQGIQRQAWHGCVCCVHTDTSSVAPAPLNLFALGKFAIKHDGLG